MSKKRKTRKEKIIAELRRKVQQSSQATISEKTLTTSQSSITFQLDTTGQNRKTTSSVPTHVTTRDYSHVLKDAQKTLMITSIILGVNIALFVAIQNKIISLSIFGL